MEFDLCGDISECLGMWNWEISIFCLLTPDGVLGPCPLWCGPRMGSWGTEPREVAVRFFIQDPSLHRESAHCLGECAMPRIPAGTSGLPHQPCPEPAPPTPENEGQTQLCSHPPYPAATLHPKQKGSGYTRP